MADKELRQGTFNGGGVEPRGNEAALLVQRLASWLRVEGCK
jgi:hypothetical protein